MKPPEIKIRFAQLQDVSQIKAFIEKLAKFEELSDQVVVTEDLLRENLFGESVYAEVLIAELKGKPSGFALFFHNFSTFLGRPGIYLEDLFVLPESRKFGVGTALLRKVAQIALERKCGRFEWSVLNWNENAIRLYKSLGAESMTEWTVNRLTGVALKNLAKESKI